MICTACGMTGHRASQCPLELWRRMAAPQEKDTQARMVEGREFLPSGGHIFSMAVFTDAVANAPRLPHPDIGQDPPFQF